MEPSKQSIKLEPTQQTKQMCEALRNADNLSETKATLEISLKNSAELLKQLSSIGQIEQMHQLETQMRESMQPTDGAAAAGEFANNNNNGSGSS